MTKHFHGLSEAEAERLAILVEECGGLHQDGVGSGERGHQE